MKKSLRQNHQTLIECAHCNRVVNSRDIAFVHRRVALDDRTGNTINEALDELVCKK